MPDLIINEYEEFHRWVIESYPQPGSLFRGHTDVAYQLIPSVGRYLPHFLSNGRTKQQLFTHERFALEVFQKESAAFHPHQFTNPWEYLALAQHHGLPTRLLDWTHNPMAALYFAVREDSEVDGTVYALNAGILIDVMDSGEMQNDPLTLSENRQYISPRIAPRIMAQESVFTIHADPTIPLAAATLSRVIIPHNAKLKLRTILFRYGMNAKVLFPGLDGIARSIRFLKFGGSA